ncbi:inositol polyphosphate 5-phosphatase K isoform X2 [Ambystoma mexicanum]|uniref:inositol polyphosphate 5-phosphatase K isoform X2 n=1 Tax=Ambystoma mexicanum TaxID=8296 RepID=UPI0037E883A0
MHSLSSWYEQSEEPPLALHCWEAVPRVRSDSLSSTGSTGRFQLRQRVAELMACVEDISSDEEIQEEVSRTLDEALLILEKKLPPKIKEFRLHLVTWNVGTASPPDDVSSLLEIDNDTAVDMFIIGLQEVNSKIIRFLSDLAFDDPWSLFIMDTLAPLGYVKIACLRLQGLLLLIFVKHQHIPFIQDIYTNYTRTGIYGYWGNKGGVTIRMCLYGHMVCFMNCHLPAHMENSNQRLDDFERILEEQQFDDSVPTILDHDLVFWFGDLNFRIADFGMHFVREAITSDRYSLLWDKDQLNVAKKNEGLLRDFKEGPLQFKPTYKFDRNSDVYDTSGKKRKPAWTDRILWRLKSPTQTTPEEEDAEQMLTVTLDNYRSHMSYGISDHKPVTGTFTVQLKPLVSTPLVTLRPEGEWNADSDGLISYSLTPEFPSSTWDWIGLYKVDFRHTNDYVTYAWVKDDEISFSEEATQVYIGADEIPLEGGEFLLCYFCHNMQSLTGISEPFQIQPGHSLLVKESKSENVAETDWPQSSESHEEL